jgi:hypothetical protein
MNASTTGKSLGLIMLLSGALAANAVLADNYFQACDMALQNPEFRVLQQYLAANPELPHPSQCFRLNNYQFLMTVTDTGRVAQGLYYFDGKMKKLGLSEGRYMPNVDVVNEFLGPNKKRFVLLHSSNLHSGAYDQLYSILHLIPTKDGKSYTHYNLISWSEDGESGLCGHSTSTDRVTGRTEMYKRIPEGKASSVSKPAIYKEGTDAINIQFTFTEQDCKTSEQKTYTRTFRLTDGAFKDSAN